MSSASSNSRLDFQSPVGMTKALVLVSPIADGDVWVGFGSTFSPSAFGSMLNFHCGDPPPTETGMYFGK